MNFLERKIVHNASRFATFVPSDACNIVFGEDGLISFLGGISSHFDVRLLLKHKWRLFEYDIVRDQHILDMMYGLDVIRATLLVVGVASGAFDWDKCKSEIILRVEHRKDQQLRWWLPPEPQLAIEDAALEAADAVHEIPAMPGAVAARDAPPLLPPSLASDLTIEDAALEDLGKSKYGCHQRMLAATKPMHASARCNNVRRK